MSKQETLIPAEVIADKILLLRERKVMLDKDLALLYQVPTKVLNQAVRRNVYRFPSDFMFKLTEQEVAILRSQIVTSSWGGQRYLPYAFTEQGVAMLSSVLNSRQAISVNIQIIRTFTRLREIIATHKDLQHKIEDLERKYNKRFKNIFQAIKLLFKNDENINQRFTYEEDRLKNKQFGFLPPRQTLGKPKQRK
ncbi:DNA-binding protein [Candidatus Termititenax persephonae]|uniref:DNA-binding protein n=1 Tax=Candidatus Termititenax persephonae TaxID=2218525 RepID=A0A388TJ92_9BACT|nr:DNA-binding protein [Candidatus Termititenax persephonae]